MTFLKNVFGTFWDFHKSAEKFSKNFEPLYPLEWTCGPQNIKNYWKWHVTKKVGPPLIYNVTFLARRSHAFRQVERRRRFLHDLLRRDRRRQARAPGRLHRPRADRHRRNQVHWTPLNRITDNGINRLMGSNLSHLTSPKLSFPT